jgi:hypothetical protein
MAATYVYNYNYLICNVNNTLFGKTFDLKLLKERKKEIRIDKKRFGWMMMSECVNLET